MMIGTNTKLASAVEAYFAELARVRASGGATSERSSYGPLANLFNAIGAALKPKVFCVGELADQGAGHPDFGLYAARQVQKGRPRDGQTPEQGVVEVKTADDDAWLTADSAQVNRYWGRYRLVLVTNTRDFVLVGEAPAGRSAKLETFRLADSADDFHRKLDKPHMTGDDFAVTTGWGHFGTGDAVMSGQGRVVERAFTPAERSAMGDALPALGAKPPSTSISTPALSGATCLPLYGITASVATKCSKSGYRIANSPSSPDRSSPRPFNN